MQKWESFTEEELQKFANQTHNQEEFCIKMGYAGRADSAIKAIRTKYPNFTFPKRIAHNLEDLTAQTFNRLTVIEKDQTKVGGKAYWICKCECGNITSVQSYDLKNGKVKSCGCFRNEQVRAAIGNNLKDKRFGKLVAKEQVNSIREQSGTLRTAWLCLCDCGNKVVVKTRDLISGDTHSCGCLSQSYGAIQIENILKENNIRYKKEFIFSDLLSKNGCPLRFDFAVFNFNDKLTYLIECQGEQHYESVDFFGGEAAFLSQKERDLKKREYCQKHNIPLVEINYFNKKEITSNEVIREELLYENNRFFEKSP